MVRIGGAAALAMVALSGCCTEMGCMGSLVVFLDRELAADAVVVVDDGFEGLTCVPASTGDSFGSCSIGVVDGRPAITVPTGMGDPADTVVLEISEGGAPAVTYEVSPTWSDDTFYPNGKHCGGGCTSGEAELVLEPLAEA